MNTSFTKKTVWVIAITTLALGACELDPGPPENRKVQGFRPVYSSNSAMEIKMSAEREINNPGKIYVYGNYLLVNESGKGIHVFDNADPANPQALGFVEMLGNTDMAIKDGVLYADHVGQLVAITLNGFTQLQEKGRLSINQWYYGVPPPSQHHFECVNPEQGVVTSWQRATLTNPDCYAF